MSQLAAVFARATSRFWLCSMAAKRPRGGDDLADGMASLFSEYFGAPTKLQKYGPGLQRRELAQHRGLILRLRSMQKNLAFQPLMVKKALASVARANMGRWRFCEEDIEVWAGDVGVRVRAMCRHIAQAQCKKTPPHWVKKFLGEEPQQSLHEAFWC